jgi:hypothetical protein
LNRAVIEPEVHHRLRDLSVFDQEQPVARQSGVLHRLLIDEADIHWASRTGHEPTPDPGSLILDGGDASLDDLIKGVERGLLVTHFWPPGSRARTRRSTDDRATTGCGGVHLHIRVGRGVSATLFTQINQGNVPDCDMAAWGRHSGGEPASGRLV